MSTNISKKKRDDLLDKIKQIRAFIAAAPQDENTGNLLSYLSELEKDVNGKKYGLIFEKHREEIDEVLDTHTPVLAEEADLFIDHGGQMNFLLEGDNLAALKLLEKTHRGKIYLIYIDPPYNTGNKDFIYDDAFVDKNDCFTHSKWLSFMEKRLKIARRLLSGNGVIFISIDDREEAGLRLLCDEIFGENCFVSNISWQRNYSARNDSKGIVTEVEHLLVYSRSEEWSPKKLPRTAEMDAKYKNPDNDFAMWRTDNAYAPGASTHQGMVYHRNPKKALLSVAKYFEETFKTGTNKAENQARLQAAGFEFSADILRHTFSGETATLDFASADMNTIVITEKLNTHDHGHMYHQKVGKIGMEIGMEYSYMNTIIRKLFDRNFTYSRKILAMEPREVYAFVINNADLLRHTVREAMAAELRQLTLDISQVSKVPFHIPQSCLFTYDGTAKTQLEMKKNVYGTEDSTEIWMLRYGFSFEEIEWLKPCVESIDQTEIRFNGEIESLDDFQRSSIAQYLF